MTVEIRFAPYDPRPVVIGPAAPGTPCYFAEGAAGETSCASRGQAPAEARIHRDDAERSVCARCLANMQAAYDARTRPEAPRPPWIVAVEALRSTPAPACDGGRLHYVCAWVEPPPWEDPRSGCDPRLAEVRVLFGSGRVGHYCRPCLDEFLPCGLVRS